MYEAKDFSHLLGTPGFSDALLNNHFTLYQGYVVNTNKLIEELKTATLGTSEYSEMRRRFGWEWNGMRLHELYFGNMKNGGALLEEGELKKVIEYLWGSVEGWAKDFKTTGAMRGIGWAILYRDPQSGNLFNVWVSDHEVGHLAGLPIILAMDVWEHAYAVDFLPTGRKEYIEAFFKNLNWDVIESHFA